MQKKLNAKLLIIALSPEDYDELFQTSWVILKAKNEKEAYKHIEADYSSLIGIIAEMNVTTDYQKLFSSKRTKALHFPIIATASNEFLKNYELALSKGADAFFKKTDLREKTSLIQNIIDKHKPLKSTRKATDELDTRISSIKEEFNNFLDSFDGHNKVWVLQGEDGVGKRFWLENLGKKHSLKVFDVKKLNDNVTSRWTRDKNSCIHIDGNQISKSKVFVFWGIENASYILQRIIDKWLSTQSKKVIFVCRNIEHAFSEEFQYQDALTFHIPALRDRKEDVNLLIDSFLKQPGVCPKHLPFFGKMAENVFHENALTRLNEHNWITNIRELKAVVKQAVCQADLDQALLIDTKHLPRIIGQNLLFSIETPEKNQLREWLLNNHVSFLSNDKPQEEKNICAKLRIIKKKYPDLLKNVEIEYIIKKKYILDAHLFMLYALQSKIYAEGFRKQLKFIDVTIYDHHDISNIVKSRQLLNEAEMTLAFLCPDIIQIELFHDLVDMYYQGKFLDSQRIKLIPIRARPILTDYHPIFSELAPLPRQTEKSIQEHDNTEQVIFLIAKEIVDLLNKYKII